MTGPNLAPLTTLKKNWKFIWYISYDGDLNTGLFANVANTLTAVKGVASRLREAASLAKKFIKGDFQTSAQDMFTFEKLKGAFMTSYVSQMAKSVTLPDDEIEIDYYKIGTLDYPVPKAKKINNISVTYYDDDLETVYNFHKCLLELVNPTDEMGYHTTSIVPFSDTTSGEKYTFRANYISYENNLSMADYAMYTAMNAAETTKNRINGLASSVASSLLGSSVVSSMSSVSNTIFTMSGLDSITADVFIGYKTKQIFPAIFPVKIHRTEADKTGDGLAEVTVDYQRVPDVSSLLSTPVQSMGIKKNTYGF